MNFICVEWANNDFSDANWLFVSHFHGMKNLVPLEGESLNSLFDELADWEHQLKHSGIDLISEFEEPSP